LTGVKQILDQTDIQYDDPAHHG